MSMYLSQGSHLENYTNAYPVYHTPETNNIKCQLSTVTAKTSNKGKNNTEKLRTNVYSDNLSIFN